MTYGARLDGYVDVHSTLQDVWVSRGPETKRGVKITLW